MRTTEVINKFYKDNNINPDSLSKAQKENYRQLAIGKEFIRLMENKIEVV